MRYNLILASIFAFIIAQEVISQFIVKSGNELGMSLAHPVVLANMQAQ